MPPSLGLESGRVRVVPYDPAWADLYAEEADRLRRILAHHGVSLVLEHTGSTAVPGLAAKPVVDILAGRHSDEAREPAIFAVQAAGYLHRGEQGIPGRDFFRRGEPRQYHVHLALVGSRFWDDHRTFRDHLRSHPGSAAAYASLKQTLATRHPWNREAYILGKSEFVRAILERARAPRGEVRP